MERETQLVKKEAAEKKQLQIVEGMLEYVKDLLQVPTLENIRKAAYVMDHCAEMAMLPDFIVRWRKWQGED